MTQTLGILGGMGPEATLYMYRTIIERTRVETDQDHIPVIVYADPRVPPRTDAILGTGPDPTPFLVQGAETLKQAGADFILMPCVTAHYFLPRVKEQVDIPFLSLLDEAVAWARRHAPGLKRAGLISSTGTLRSRLFHDAFEAAGIDILAPEQDEQDKIVDCIFGARGIKAGHTSGPSRDGIVRIARRLCERGAGAVIAGCTEVPLVLEDADIPVPLIEPMRITAEAGILRAGFPLKTKEEADRD